jgi:hypothetical protein
MNPDEFSSEPSERRKIWNFRTVHMSLKPHGYFRHGIEQQIPKVHELVLLYNEAKLRIWLEENPEDVANRFRHKTPILLAIKHDSYECFKRLLQRNANIEERNPKNETTLMIAVRLNRTRMIRDLISHDANIRTQDRMWRTVTEIIISRDDVENLQILHLHYDHILEHDLYNQEFPNPSN